MIGGTLLFIGGAVAIGIEDIVWLETGRVPTIRITSLWPNAADRPNCQWLLGLPMGAGGMIVGGLVVGIGTALIARSK